MPTVRKNKSTRAPANGETNQEEAPHPADIAAFNLSLDSLPEGLHPDVDTFLRFVRQLLLDERPDTTQAVVAYTPVAWSKKPEKITLYMIGSHDRYYTGMRVMSSVLARGTAQEDGEQYEAGPLDDIYAAAKPLTTRDWREAFEQKRNLIGQIQRRGILLYET